MTYLEAHDLEHDKNKLQTWKYLKIIWFNRLKLKKTQLNIKTISTH